MPKTSLPVKHRLTLTQLSAYDDILTDALVDHVYFWTTIRKNKNAYHPSRGITEEDISEILQKHVIVEHDPAKAATKILALSGIKKFHDALKTEAEKKDFREHLRRYVNIYSTDCPWEVSTTNRYTVVTQEAAVSARRDIKRGETIKYLCGVQVQLTEEEEENIKFSKRDFSIVVSSRSKTASLFLGPARFANHDCDANARLQTTGNNGMEIVAFRSIDEGEEVTVSYGENYFGEDNCECLCQSCEKQSRNGWTRKPDTAADSEPKQSIESGSLSTEAYSLRRRSRMAKGLSYSRSPSRTPDIVIRPHIAKRTPRSLRFQATNSPLGNSFSTNSELPQEGSPTPSKRKLDMENVQGTPSKRRVATKLREEASMGHDLDYESSAKPDLSNDSSSHSSRPSPSPSSVDNQTLTDATSVEGDDTVIIGAVTAPNVQHKKVSTLEQADAGETILVDCSTTREHPAIVNKAIPDIHDNKTDDVLTKSATKNQKTKRKSIAPVSDKDHAPAIRYPGDYVLTPALLSEPAMSWIVCKHCEEPFVQKDAYFTKATCPRCERHSKLYGYWWPKTDPENEEDEEERVLDHRTIHRFINPAEEKLSRMLARSSSGTGSQMMIRDISEIDQAANTVKNIKQKSVKVEKGLEDAMHSATQHGSAQHSKPKGLSGKTVPVKRGVGRPRKVLSSTSLLDTNVKTNKSPGRRASGKRS